MANDLVCIGLTTLDVVARPVNRFPEDGLDLVEQIVLAPAGTAGGPPMWRRRSAFERPSPRRWGAMAPANPFAPYSH
jgi:hypothetical protein